MLSNIMTIPLTLLRDEGGSWDEESGKYIEGGTTEVPIECSIQPFGLGEKKLLLPEGVKSTDALIIFTTTPIKNTDQHSNTNADKTVVKGHTYVAFNVENWSFHGLESDHYKVLFLKDDVVKELIN
jgi:hypothetical protein